MQVATIEITKNHNTEDNKYIVYLATGFWNRFMGLMGKKSLPERTGLFFPKCSSIHCFFMKMPIDVVYLDDDYTVLFKETVMPWHIGKFVKGAKHILELGEYDSNNIGIGEKIIWLTGMN